MKKIKDMLSRIGTAGLAAVMLTAQMPVTAFAEKIEESQAVVVSDEAIPAKVQMEDVLPIETDGDTAVAETDGFSLYTVEFTYNDLQYVMEGDSSIALSEILDKVNLTGEVSAVEVSDTSLFSADKENGVWVVIAHKAFSTDEWMKVTINEVVYEITVTDDPETASVTYVGANGETQTCASATILTGSSTSLAAGWYVVNADVTIVERISVSGSVNLILGNGATLTASKGITVGSDATLNVYAQTNDEETMGALVADGTNDKPNWYAGIGGVENADAGTITINGGKINATGWCAAGIGSGGGTSTVGTITINGGIVTAQDNAHYGAGIGGGFSGGKAGTINLNGGVINAAGIGSGDFGGDCSITVNISDGVKKIVATPVQGGACIGKGKSASGSVTVNFISGGNIVTGDAKEAVFYDTGEGAQRQVRAKAMNHAVTMSDDLKANITATSEYAFTGETVTLTLGTAVDATTLSVNDGAVATTDAGNRQYTFTMPDGDVTVTATLLQTYAVSLPANMEVVSATNAADADGKYITGTTVTFKASFPYAASNVSDGTSTLEPDANGIYTVTVADADVTITATVERSATIDLTDAPGDFNAIEGDVLTGTTSHTVTIAADAVITLSGATISGGIVCEGTATITLVGTNSVNVNNVSASSMHKTAGIQIGGSGTTLTIRGDGSLTATGGSQAAGIGLGRTWDASVTAGVIVIEGGTVNASGDIGIGIGTVGNSQTATIDGISIKGGTVSASLGKGYIYNGCTATVGYIKIYDTIDMVDASKITESVTYMHDDTDVTASASDYFTIIENGNRRIIVPKDDNDYTITIADGIEHGTLTVAETAKYMETVTVTATPAFGYRFVRLIVKDAQNNDVASTGNTFQMPKGGATVSAVFEQGTHGTTEFVWGYPGPDSFVNEATIYDGVTTVNIQNTEVSYNILKNEEYTYSKFLLDNNTYDANIPYAGGTGEFYGAGNGTNFNVPYNGQTGYYDITLTDVGNGKWGVSILPTPAQMDVVPDQTYTGSAITPEPLVIAGSLSLTKGEDYVYSYTNNTNAGTATVTVTFKGNYASLGSVEKEFTIVPHIHNFSYSAEGATITATCSKDSCPLTDNKATLTINAPIKTIYGDANSASATLTGLDDFNSATSLNITETGIKYVGKGNTTYAESDTAPVNAGTYTASITAGSKTASVDYTIAPKPISSTGATATDRDYVKDSTSVEISAVTFDGATLTNETDYTVTGAMDDDTAGDSKSVTVTVTLMNGNYTFGTNGNTTTTNVKINKVNHDGVTASGSAKYGEEGTVALSPFIEAGGMLGEVSVSDTNNVLDGTPTIETDGKNLKFKFANNSSKVGKTATVTIPVRGATNYNDYNIVVTLTVTDKVVPTLSVSDFTKTYDGNAVTADHLTKSAKVGSSDVEGTWTFEGNPGLKDVSDSGTITVRFTPTDTANYESATATFMLTINRKAVTVKADNKSMVVGTTPEPELTATVNGTVGSDTVDYTITREAGTAVGTYTITPRGDAEQGNYAVSYETGTFTITEDATTPVVKKAPKAITGLVYNGKAQALVEPGEAENGKMVYAVVRAGDPEPSSQLYTASIPAKTDAGTYYVWYKVKGDTNHNDTEPKSVQVTVAKAPHSNQTAGGSAKYGASGTVDLSALIEEGGTVGTITKTDSSNVLDGDTSVSDGKLNFAFADTENNAGKTATVIVPVTSANYLDYNITVTLTVKAKEVPVLTVDPITKTYDGAAVTGAQIRGTATVNGTAVTGTWAFEGGASFINVADSGAKKVIFTPEDTATYDKAEVMLALTINKAVITIKAADKSIYVGDTVPSLYSPVLGKDYTVTGLVGSDRLETAPTLSYSAAPDNTKAGSYTITASGAVVPASDNYADAISYQTGTLTIKAKSGGGSTDGGNTGGGGSSGGGSSTGGGGDSGGGGGSPSPVTPSENYTVPVSGENTVEVTTEITNGNAVINEISKSDIDRIIDGGSGSKSGDESIPITIDVSQAKSEVSSVELSGKTMERLTEAVNAENNIESVEIKLTNATVTLDGAALSAVNEQAEGKSVTLAVEDTNTGDLNKAQQRSLKQFDSARPFRAAFESGGKEIHDFKGGSVRVSLSFSPEKGRDARYYHIYYLPKAGTMERLLTYYTKGLLSFVTSHFSDYAIVYDQSIENGDPVDPEEPVDPEDPEDPQDPEDPEEPAKTIEMHRLYNPNSGEHFYTGNVEEKDHLVELGWNYEGVAWNAPEKSKIPVYRLYNPNAGDHHYTTDVKERDHLIEVGWNDEGIGWYSEEPETVALFRLYNPNALGAGAHHFTADAAERDHLIEIGWRDEKTGWYGALRMEAGAA